MVSAGRLTQEVDMSGAIGLGMTHYPPLAGTDEQMAGILGWTHANMVKHF